MRQSGAGKLATVPAQRRSPSASDRMAPCRAQPTPLSRRIDRHNVGLQAQLGYRCPCSSRRRAAESSPRARCRRDSPLERWAVPPAPTSPIAQMTMLPLVLAAAYLGRREAGCTPHDHAPARVFGRLGLATVFGRRLVFTNTLRLAARPTTVDRLIAGGCKVSPCQLSMPWCHGQRTVSPTTDLRASGPL